MLEFDVLFTGAASPSSSICFVVLGDEDTKGNAIAVNSLFNVDIVFERKSLIAAITEMDLAEHASNNHLPNGSVIWVEKAHIINLTRIQLIIDRAWCEACGGEKSKQKICQKEKTRQTYYCYTP